MRRYILPLLLLLLATGSHAQRASNYFHDDGERDSLIHGYPEGSSIANKTFRHLDKNFVIDERLIPAGTSADAKVLKDDQNNDVAYRNYEEHSIFGNLRVRRMTNRKALVGDHCVINKLVTEVGVGSWAKDLGNMLDEDLNNFAQFNKVVGAAVTVNPIVSVRDMENYYAAGTKAGFCIVASSGNSVLTLDVVKAMGIGFYRDGHLVNVRPVEEGQDASGVGLKLIQIPGSDDACIMLTATSTCVFDEICLDESGGVDLSVGKIFKVKYAFVGESRSYNLTKVGVRNYGQGLEDPRSTSVDYAKGWNPVLLGIPFPLVKKEITRLVGTDTDEKLDEYASITPIVGAAYFGGVKVMCKDDANPGREVFGPGYDVGFKFKNTGGLDLSVGQWARMILFDRDGNKVQEETVNAQVLGLTVAQAGEQTASITSDVPFSGVEIRFHGVLKVDVGATLIYNGFVNRKPDVDHHCDIRPHADRGVCDSNHDIQLLHNDGVHVTWSLDKDENGNIKAYDADGNLQPNPQVKVSPDGLVTCLFDAGTYHFRATADDGCSDATVITYGIFGEDAAIDAQGHINPNAQCGLPLVNGVTMGKYAISDKIYDSSGSLISISSLEQETQKHLVENDFNTFVEYSGGLSLASNLCIIGIKCEEDNRKNPDGTHQTKPDGTNTNYIFDSRVDKGRRVGFIVEAATTGLDLSLLQFFQIRCYENGHETYRHVISESNAVSVGLAGSDKMQKVRYSIALPEFDDDDNYYKVDEFQLWTSGVLNLKGDKLRIYYAFIDEDPEGCASPLNCGTELLSYKNHARLNGNASTLGEAVAVARTINNISNFLDDSPSTAMNIAQPVNLGGFTLAFYVGRTVDAGNQLGIITDNKTYVANVSVGSWLKARTYLHGEETGDEYTDWNVLGADVAGYGDKNFLYIRPTTAFDEVRLEFGSVANVLNEQNIYGMFLRHDADGDNMPDCQDVTSCPAVVKNTDACVGEKVPIKFEEQEIRDYITAHPNHTYQLVTNEPGVTSGSPSNPRIIADSEIDLSKSIHSFHTTQTVGQGYTCKLYDATENRQIAEVTYTVHPLRTTWKTNAKSTRWDNWDNWTDGTPYCCTDVIIPSNAERYPVLSPDLRLNNTSPILDYYCCNNILVQPGGAVQRTELLNYDRAWVDVDFAANRYRFFTPSLKNTYSGDLFHSDAANYLEKYGNYFVTLDETNAPEDAQSRLGKPVYQRMWNTTVTTALASLPSDPTSAPSYTNAEATASHWTHYFNSVKHLYDVKKGDVASVWVDDGEMSNHKPVRFRFPKLHTTYHYYSDLDNQLQATQTDINRSAQYDDSNGSKCSYRFIYEEQGKDFPYTHASNNSSATDATTEQRKVYADGDNCTITLTLTTNNNGSTTKFLVGNPYVGRIYLSKFFEANTNITSVSFPQDETQDVVIERTADLTQAPYNSLEPMGAMFVNYNAAATTQTATLTTDMMSPEETSTAPSPSSMPQMRITAICGTLRAATLLMEGREEAPNLIHLDGEVAPTLAFFGLAPQADDATTFNACDILATADELPLGIIAPDTAQVTLSFRAAGLFPRDDYYLLDRTTNDAWPLEDDITLPTSGTTIGRYAIRRGDVYNPTPVTTPEAKPIVTVHSRTATVRGARSLRAYTTTGALIASGTEQVALQRGINILQVTTQEGRTVSYRLAVK